MRPLQRDFSIVSFMQSVHYCLRYHFVSLSCLFQSYAGKYVPAIAYRIHLENQGTPKVKINLKGIAIGDGLVDPVNVSKELN